MLLYTLICLNFTLILIYLVYNFCCLSLILFI